ncbi:transporter substrate-binding domain-containing protein [Endozoicomonas sp. SM1973]|uniref:Transporter substrate-binding domain-containing protein n=1 Tax=Spartinivicinus marinus TaxID=2994442 RepID=A0A853IB36_9GAMM|nr:transporter substrate-binding domain-containing protein [Spartinivicinus marinus]MCX4026908.1 transporter substrate-binding domain-containing protein [Spartinivicinus marinus]NYZ66747.1 transporter substrate-binding domain-containing protein [Spartinivicinus marinus]
MKKLLSLTLIIYASFTQANNTISLAGGEWPPYVSESLKYYGITPRILTEVFATQDITVRYQFTSWARALEMVRKGKADGTFLWSKTSEREKDFFYSKEPIGNISYVFFHLKDNPFAWSSFEDLRGKRIAATIGYHYSDEFNRYEKEGLININRVKSDLQLLKMLYKQRVDIIPHDLTVGYYEINKHFPESLKKLFTNHPLPIKKKPAYLLMSKNNNNKKIIDIFDKAIANLKKSGKYDQYYFDDLLANKYEK